MPGARQPWFLGRRPADSRTALIPSQGPGVARDARCRKVTSRSMVRPAAFVTSRLHGGRGIGRRLLAEVVRTAMSRAAWRRCAPTACGRTATGGSCATARTRVLPHPDLSPRHLNRTASRSVPLHRRASRRSAGGLAGRRADSGCGRRGSPVGPSDGRGAAGGRSAPVPGAVAARGGPCHRRGPSPAAGRRRPGRGSATARIAQRCRGTAGRGGQAGGPMCWSPAALVPNCRTTCRLGTRCAPCRGSSWSHSPAGRSWLRWRGRRSTS